jgi:hypothetical protein
MFTALNLRRLMNMVDKNEFKKFLKELVLLWFAKIDASKQFLTAITLLFFSATFYMPRKRQS